MKDEVYSHGHHKSVVNAHAIRTAEDCAAYLLPELKPGMMLLDVGCGPGSITVDLAERVAPGQVIGLDRSDDVLTQAAELAALRGIENATFVSGNIYDLEFDDDTFDVVHAHQVLQHLTDPVAALYEMRRVVKPGGIVAVRDADFHGMSWYPELPELADWMATYQQIARGNRAEPDAGRHFISWAQAAGFPRSRRRRPIGCTPPKNSAAGRAMSGPNASCTRPTRNSPWSAGCWTRPGWSGLRRAGWPGRTPRMPGS